ncbi:MAG: hypothetical protein CME70_17555 [Halobacteriovorax sp.]|nr:hypothetical protein [Halobacteriovorax sp.]
MNNKKDLLANLFSESSAYTNMDAIESLVNGGKDLSQIPVQPLYLAIKSLPMDKAGLYLEKMSTEQRQACLDLDLWQKDNVDVEEFAFWVKSYSLCPDEEVRREFIGSTEFFLYLKSRFNVWTFDVEDPEYPDHDNYFLTDDSLLLFEFDQDFEYVHEVRSFIRELYGERGVEGAYTYLFKMVSGSFMEAMEDEYQDKKDRLRELGFVDYFDSLEVENVFPNMGLLHNFIKKKKPSTANLERTAANQNLHQSSIAPYKDKLDSFSEELSKITDQKRVSFLQFSFIRLVNSTLSFGHALKEGPIAMSRVGNRTRSLLELGYNYLSSEGKEFYKLDEGIEFFDLFDFRDLYQVGNSLVGMIQKETKKILSQFLIEDKKEAFLGTTLVEILEEGFGAPILSAPEFSGKFEEVKTYQSYINLKDSFEFLNQIIPFAHGFYSQMETLSNEGKMRDEFYLNYKLADIDFECLLLTSMANFKLGQLDTDEKKLGLTVNEYREFAGMVTSGESLLSASELNKVLDSFVQKFGLVQVGGIKYYLLTLLEKHMSGYDFSELPEEDFKHVGGPILLNLN